MRTRVGYAILLGLTFAVAVKAYRSPLPTFDRLLYAAAVANLHSSDPNQIAQQATSVRSIGRAITSADIKRWER
jgi:hypothetical protein